MNYERLPVAMRNTRRWLLWKSIPNPDPTKKPRKVPLYSSGIPRNGPLDTPADLSQLDSFDEVLRVLQAEPGKYAGLGFALGPDGTGNNWQGIDLDDLPVHPELAPVAQELPGYTEASPGGDGKHAVGYGRPFAALGSNGTGVEAYSSGRFFTVTAKYPGSSSPTCLADFVERRLQPMHGSKPKAQGTPDQDVEVVSPETVADLRSALLSMRSDDRDLWVKIGHALHALGDVGRGLWMDWSATSEKFDPADAARAWDSFKPTHTGYQVVFAEAQRHDWVNPRRRTPAPDSGIFGSGPGAVPPGPGNAASAVADTVASLEQHFVPMTSVVDQANCFIPHIVDMWIPHDEVTLFAGHGGTGKSYVALSIAIHVALGRPFGNLTTTQATVLFFSCEDGARVLRQRVARICRALNIDPQQLDGRLLLLDASDIDPALYRERRIGTIGYYQTVTETPLLDALADLTQKHNIGLVVVDNASDTYDGDEIKRAAVRTFVRSLRQRIARPGRAVLLLAHINKESAKAGRSASAEDYSGSTAWHNSVRSRLSLIPDGDNALKIEHAKANLGPKAAPIRLEWHAGVPLVAGSFSGVGAEAASVLLIATEKARDDADKGALVELIKDFDRRGECVTTSAQGSATVYHLFRGQPGFPKNTNSERLMRLLRELESAGDILRHRVRTPTRKWKEVFTCTTQASESAPIPNIPSAQARKAA